MEAVLRSILSHHFYYNHHTECFHCNGCDRILNADLEDAEQCSNPRCDWVKANALLAEAQGQAVAPRVNTAKHLPVYIEQERVPGTEDKPHAAPGASEEGG